MGPVYCCVRIQTQNCLVVVNLQQHPARRCLVNLRGEGMGSADDFQCHSLKFTLDKGYNMLSSGTAMAD